MVQDRPNFSRMVALIVSGLSLLLLAAGDETVVEVDGAALAVQGAHGEGSRRFFRHVEGAIAQRRQVDVVGRAQVDRRPEAGRMMRSGGAWSAGKKPTWPDGVHNGKGAWLVEETNRSVWLLSYDGPDSWEAANAASYSSPQRPAMAPIPRA